MTSGDGDIDLAAAVSDAFQTGGAVEVLENLGDGRFGPAQALPSLTIAPRILVRAGDVDSDGAVDLVAVAGSSVSTPTRLDVYWGVGDGSFTPGEAVRVPGIFTPTTPYTPTIWDLELGDIDGDGDLDVVTDEEARENACGGCGLAHKGLLPTPTLDPPSRRPATRSASSSTSAIASAGLSAVDRAARG